MPDPNLDTTPDEAETLETENTAQTTPTDEPQAIEGPRMVMCVKLRRELIGLERAPVPGELGQRIYENVSQQAWQMWQDHSRLLINHYGLNLADPDARMIMRQQMEEFFFGANEEKPEGWVPEGQGGAKGKGAPEPAAQRKK